MSTMKAGPAVVTREMTTECEYPLPLNQVRLRTEIEENVLFSFFSSEEIDWRIIVSSDVFTGFNF